MKQITEAENLQTKTIERTAYIDNAFFLFFTDKTFCVFQGCGWDEKDVELMDYEFNLNPNNSNFTDLYKIGIITNEERMSLGEKFTIENQQKIADNEIEQLKKLKAKYPNV